MGEGIRLTGGGDDGKDCSNGMREGKRDSTYLWG